ncbi:hypothetical protein [Streptomyces sp. HB2AG]|uniref:hypothetical protein n=2 Tax=Streptomyces TaxID=1883 RepID=UPI0022AB0B06|nr:hypothetical protein [Streptomyces sp. HB2AG]MCZ2525465.1 hypothetical protein [Streptomyces sp. HB2AG]
MSATPTPPPGAHGSAREPDTAGTSPVATANGQGTAQTGPPGAPEEAGRRRSFTLNLPLVTMQFHSPQLSKAQLQQRAQAQMLKAQAAAAHAPHVPGMHLPKPHVPRAEHVAYYGGLGALALLEVIEWPVAAAIGVGTAVAERVGRTSGAQERPAAQEQAQQPAPPPSSPAAAASG